MLDTTKKVIQSAVKHLGLSEEEGRLLLKANHEHIFEIELKNGKKFDAFRVQHNNILGPYKGGIRFHSDVNINEVRALATLMSIKTAALGLPLGGGKGGVSVDPRLLTSAELEELSRAYARYLHKNIGPNKDIPAPDVNTNATIIDWMVDEYEKLTGDISKASFTGKSVAKGGSLGREAATGRGGVMVLDEYLKLTDQDEDPLTIAIQGFGNVGIFFGEIAEVEQKNWQLVSATDSSGGISDAFGLSSAELALYKKASGRLIAYKSDTAVQLTNEQLLAEDVDVLVLAALGDVINEANMKQVKARIILELANGPVDEAAHKYLAKKGVVIIPDVLANAGGVVVSYLEWQQNLKNEKWTEKQINIKLKQYIVKATKDIYKYSQKNNLSLREAATSLAITSIINGRRK